MNVRFPLYTKILFWFFLNLVLLVSAFSIFVGAQFRLGLDSLLLGPAGNPIQDVSQIITHELARKPHDEWNGVLKSFGEEYHVQFALFHNTGIQVAGESVTLPAPVIERLKGPAPQPRRGPGMRGEAEPGPPPGQDFEPPPDGPPGQPFNPQRGRPPPGAQPKFMVHTSGPSRYWVGVRIRPPEGERLGPMPLTLLAISQSIGGAGLFVNFLPWVMFGLAALALSVLLWLPLVRGITRAISQMTRATEQIAQGRFDARIASQRRDELGSLSQAINQMASRLTGFVTGQKRFLGDIAHELCSPIARIQLALGILEQRADAKQTAYIEDLREEVQHMSNLVNELLSFSKASLEPAAVKLQSVNLLKVVEQAVRRENAANAKICVDVPGELSVQADPELLLRSIGNLIRNAIRYAGEAGPINVSAHAESSQVIVSVIDCGPGVPEDSLAQLFDPFYRPELSRNRETGGVGLGLAIVKTCVESCQGTVHCQNRQPSGLEVSITLQKAIP